MTICNRIEDIVTLPPNKLNKDINIHIFNLVKKKIGTFSLSYGFILEIENINIISSDIMLINNDIIFTVSYDIKSICPKVGNIYFCTKIDSFLNKGNEYCAILTKIKIYNTKVFDVLMTNCVNDVENDNTIMFDTCDCKIVVNESDNVDVDISYLKIKLDYVGFKNNKFVLTGRHIHE